MLATTGFLQENRSFMKQLYIVLIFTLVCFEIQGQPILSNGFGTGTALIDGTTYKKTTNIGTGNFGNVSASADGQFFYATGANATAEKIYYIGISSSAIVDSVSLPGSGGDMSSTKLANTVFSLRNMAVYRLNPQTKAIDSLVLPGKPNRIEERPGAMQAWIAADSMIYIVDYTSGLNLSASIDVSSNKFDNSDVRFTKGGTTAYKAANNINRIFRIDGITQLVTDSIDTTPFGHAAIEVSTDSSKVYAAAGTNVYIYSVASGTLIDSMVSDKPIMNLYRHPTRAELWAVHHFHDSVSVFDETNKALIASFDIGNDPFFLAFSTGTVSITGSEGNRAPTLYPNPATNILKVSLAGKEKVKLVVYDIAGRKVLEQISTAGDVVVDIRALKNGAYYLAAYENGIWLGSTAFLKQ